MKVNGTVLRWIIFDIFPSFINKSNEQFCILTACSLIEHIYKCVCNCRYTFICICAIFFQHNKQDEVGVQIEVRIFVKYQRKYSVQQMPAIQHLPGSVSQCCTFRINCLSYNRSLVLSHFYRASLSLNIFPTNFLHLLLCDFYNIPHFCHLFEGFLKPIFL